MSFLPNIKMNINIIYKCLLFIILLLGNTTGIVKEFTNAAFAECNVIIVTFLFALLLIFRKKKYNYLDFLFIFIAIYSIMLTIIHIALGNVEINSLIGFYYFLLPCVIFINRDSVFIKNNIDLYFKILLLITLINVIYAIYQVIVPSAFIPIDGYRARGLMKSTLNFSGILGASFYPLLFYKLKNNILKGLSSLLILIGGFFTLSKGFFTNIIVGFFASYPIQLIINRNINKKMIVNFVKYFLIGLFILTLAVVAIIKTGTIEKYEQFVNILNFTTNGANVERLNSWKMFFDYFFQNPLGYGVGQIDSGTSFVQNSVNFESYILSVLYSLGFLGIIYFSIPILYLYKLRLLLSPKQYQLFLMFFIGIIIQNLIQVSLLTPTTTVICWLNFIFLANYFIRENNKGIKYKD